MEEFVSREEFESLKREVHELKTEVKSEFSRSNEFLQKIDKKIDVIFERMDNAAKISNLENEKIESNVLSKMEPVKKDIQKNAEEIKDIKDNNKWLWRTIGATIIGIAIKVIFDMV